MIGIEEKDMIINRIPAKTWNHLHMNQSKVGEVVINRTGELNASVNDVSLIDDGKLNNGELDNIIGVVVRRLQRQLRSHRLNLYII